MVPEPDFFLFLLYLLILKFNNAAALQTNQMIMVVPPQATLIQAVSPIEVMDLQEIVLGQKPQRPVDRCPGNSGLPFLQLPVKLLGTEMPAAA